MPARQRHNRQTPARSSPSKPAPAHAMFHVAPQVASPTPVRAASPRDLAYVVKLQKQHSDAVGFIPRAALAYKIERSRIHLALENDEPAGYLHHGSMASGEVRVFQAAIQYDAQRRHLGLALVDDLVRRSVNEGAKAISLRCLSQLEANDFWRAAGFRLLGTEPGAKGTLNAWGRVLEEGSAVGVQGSEAGSQGSGVRIQGLGIPAQHVVAANGHSHSVFPFHSRLHPCPRCGRWTTDTWARGARRFALCPACLAASAER